MDEETLRREIAAAGFDPDEAIVVPDEELDSETVDILIPGPAQEKPWSEGDSSTC